MNGFRGKESVAETPKPNRRIRLVASSYLSSSSSKDSNLSISDLRNILVIKETELRMLRDTMAKNESAILQVFEDKKRRWQMEMADRKAEWQRQLEAANSRSWKAEQLLKFQVAKLHQENKRLQAQADELSGDKRRLSDRCHSLERELDGLKTDMRGLLADVSTKDGDVIRSSAIDADRYKIAAANCELVEARSEVTAGVNARSKRRGDPCRDTGALGATELRRELDAARRAVESGRAEFERERQGWALEKEKVVDYQKRLQLVYLQVLHKNRLLELDVQQLTGEMAELDVRMQLTGSDGTPQPEKQLEADDKKHCGDK